MHGDIVSSMDMENRETRPEPFVARVRSTTPSLQKVFEFLLQRGAEFILYFHIEVHKSVLTNISMELKQLPWVNTLDFAKF